MDDSSHRENGRHKPPQGQWLMHHQPSMKQIMSIMAERDAAIQERNLAISEKKSALAERDMAVMQRDSAISERNNAIIERDNAIATLHYRDTAMNNANISPGGPACQITSGARHIHHPHHHHPRMVETPYANRDIHIPVTLPMPPVEPVKPVRTKRTKEAKPATPAKRVAKSSKRVKRASQNGPGPDMGGGSDDLTRSKPAWKEHDLGLKNGPGPDMGGGSDDLNRAKAGWKEHDLGLKNGPGPDTGGGGDDVNRAKPGWKEHDLGLNQVAYDETMPVPVCSCTGVLRACYKWGNGGWQSSCCTTNLSMYPLPAVPNKRHARVGGRKMSGSAFNKLLSRLASEGHDLSNPVDLKDRWARHGTNRYITIK